ncbi:MAG: hypothetical protein OWQ47_02855 [Acidianus infernus]|nr:hypothetical protein [Acidianus infernus]
MLVRNSILKDIDIIFEKEINIRDVINVVITRKMNAVNDKI